MSGLLDELKTLATGQRQVTLTKDGTPQAVQAHLYIPLTQGRAAAAIAARHGWTLQSSTRRTAQLSAPGSQDVIVVTLTATMKDAATLVALALARDPWPDQDTQRAWAAYVQAGTRAPLPVIDKTLAYLLGETTTQLENAPFGQPITSTSTIDTHAVLLLDEADIDRNALWSLEGVQQLTITATDHPHLATSAHALNQGGRSVTIPGGPAASHTRASTP